MNAHASADDEAQVPGCEGGDNGGGRTQETEHVAQGCAVR